MQEFQVNEYISLKLEEGRTKLYVLEEEFHQCRVLLLNLEVDKIKSYDNIDSIDEAAEFLNYPAGGYDIPAETEFWGHCSNIQAWAEHDYDTRIIHRNLAFSLLKKLTDIGDPVAKKVFKEEIAKRICSGYQPVIDFLVEEHYLRYLGFKEFEVLFNDPNFQKLETLDLSWIGLKLLPDSIENLTSLKKLDLRYNKLTTLPETMRNLKELRILDLSENLFSIFPKVIFKINSLDTLNIGYNYLTFIPETILQLKRLKKINYKGNPIAFVPDYLLEFQYGVKKEHCHILIELEKIVKRDFEIYKMYDYKDKQITKLMLVSCNLIEIPTIVFKIDSLKSLILSNNKISKIPDSISSLNLLRELDISNNLSIRELPESLWDLTSLRILSLGWNNFRELPDSVGNLIQLKKLDLSYNWLETIPESIGNLTNLEELNLYSNKIKYLPETIGNLEALRFLNLAENLLKILPEQLSKLSNLIELKYRYNRFLKIPESIVERGFN